jgi:hypothetical protein
MPAPDSSTPLWTDQSWFIILFILFKFLLHLLLCGLMLSSSVWLMAALWYQQPLGKTASMVVIGLWLVLTISVLGIYTLYASWRMTSMVAYSLCFLLGLLWYFNIEPSNDRQWDPEVARIVDYEQLGNRITIHNIRNFDWHSPNSYTPHWETRQYDLSQLNQLDVVTSYWMGPQIAHTLMSFGFADGQYLTFSIEIRKEKGEQFSSIGGFFRKYELSLVAADEKDIIYTRSNMRGEQVYIYPVNMPQKDIQQLFISYLQKAEQLKQQPRWYNTLTSNCTTLVFDMIKAIIPQLPVDYRLLVSGYLPNYIYDLKGLNTRYSFTELQQKAYVNPRTKGFEQRQDQSSQAYSRLIREGVPQP